MSIILDIAHDHFSSSPFFFFPPNSVFEAVGDW